MSKILGASMLTSYVPAGTAAKCEESVSVRLARRRSPDPSFFKLTLACGTTAPDGSVTVPVKVPVMDCA